MLLAAVGASALLAFAQPAMAKDNDLHLDDAHGVVLLAAVGATALVGFAQQAITNDDDQRRGSANSAVLPIIRAADTDLQAVLRTASDGNNQVLFATIMRSDSGDNDGDPVWVVGSSDSIGDTKLRSYHINSGEQLTDNGIFWGSRKFDPIGDHSGRGSRNTLDSTEELAANPVKVDTNTALRTAASSTDLTDEAASVTLIVAGDIRYYQVLLVEAGNVQSTKATSVSVDADSGAVLSVQEVKSSNNRGKRWGGGDDSDDQDEGNNS
ncbi:MAG: hypothetical protein K0U78_12225 [Actinomycetia bacterium]|nr:hypothetical protein [Actinomycetes bacterium]